MGRPWESARRWVTSSAKRLRQNSFAKFSNMKSNPNTLPSSWTVIADLHGAQILQRMSVIALENNDLRQSWIGFLSLEFLGLPFMHFQPRTSIVPKMNLKHFSNSISMDSSQSQKTLAFMKTTSECRSLDDENCCPSMSTMQSIMLRIKLRSTTILSSRFVLLMVRGKSSFTQFKTLLNFTNRAI